MELTKVETYKIKRERKDLSLTDIAKAIDTDRSNLSKYEREQLAFPKYLWHQYYTYIDEYVPIDKF